MPSSFVCALFANPVAWFVAVTVTPGTAELFGSATRPSMLPVFACDWAKTLVDIEKITNTKRHSRTKFFMIKLLSEKKSNFVDALNDVTSDEKHRQVTSDLAGRDPI